MSRVHTYFRIVCACKARMHGETDGPFSTLLRIFVEVHEGPEHYVVVETVTGPLKPSEMRTLAQLDREARQGLKAKRAAVTA